MMNINDKRRLRMLIRRQKKLEAEEERIGRKQVRNVTKKEDRFYKVAMKHIIKVEQQIVVLKQKMELLKR